MVQNSQHTWAGNNVKLMDSIEERLVFFKKKLLTLQSKIKSMRASENNLLKEKITLKKHNSTLANMVTNLNSYIIQL